jgi:MFS family permease
LVKRFSQKYVQFLKQPGIARLMAVALAARMPIGMVAFSMLMFLREALGNFALAGSAVGIHFVAMAVAAPVIGRLVDRLGPRRPLCVTGIVQPLALLGVLAAAKLSAPFAVVALMTALAGAFASPITVLTRTVWRRRFEREDDRRTAFALDAVMIEINFTLGPAIVAAVLATAGATAAFLLSLVAVVAALCIFVGSPAIGYFKREDNVERHLLGPLTEPRLWILFSLSFGLTVCLGLLEVGYPAYATGLGMPALGGLLIAINSLGSAVGGAIYGGLHLRASIERQFTGAVALMTVPLFLHTVAGTPALLASVAFLAGALIAPSIASQSVLVSRLAPSHYATEAFTWSSTFIVTGLGAGMALGGFLVETEGVRFAFAIAGAVIALVAVTSLALGPAPRPASSPRPP